GGVLACAFCLREVTTAAARISVGGAHEHSFVNPHGLRFRIGCFADAAGRTAGEPSTYWTWFPGHSWQVELCATCGEHLGWLFRSADTLFHGLILDRLVEVDGGPG
ncbi:MAG TPA: cereblon family protein, partial [Vicinamibacteria bacterium]|nr:cereblon family protein [Vicinamibacteria bacterium]